MTKIDEISKTNLKASTKSFNKYQQLKERIALQTKVAQSQKLFSTLIFKVEKILKGSLDSIPSPSVKIQIMGGKVCLRSKGKTLLGIVNKLLKAKSLLTSPSNVLPYYLK